MERRVAIVGMGAISPLGLDCQSMWSSLLAGNSGIDRISAFDASTFPVQIAAEVKGFGSIGITKETKLNKYLSRSVQMLISASEMALAEANIKVGGADPSRVGVALGASTSPGSEENLSYVYDFVRNDGEWDYHKIGKRGNCDPKQFLKNFMNMASCILSIIHKVNGPNLTVHTACASGSQAIGEAFRIIQRGDADIMICGGCDAMIDLISLSGFILLGVLSKNNKQPQKASRPFDKKRDGFVLGEGAGVLILEELSHALKRNAHIHAELVGYGCSSNAYRITDIHTDCHGAVLAMESALKDANLKAEDIGYINAHGTSTVQNDKTETKAIKVVFGDYAYQVPISSIKSMMGHAIAATGSLELIATVLTVAQGFIPPTINYEVPDPKCDLDYVPNVMRKADIDAALSNSFAFGGQNAALIIKKYRAEDSLYTEEIVKS